MIVGDQNPSIYLKDISRKRLATHSNLFVRTVEGVPFAHLIPDIDDLLDETRRNVETAGTTSINVISTQQSDENISHTFGGLVSIIVPTYQVQDFIIETLESIKCQDYKNKEIVIVDDGSEDKTAERILYFMSKYSDSLAVRFVQIPHMGNPGLPRNVALYNFMSQRTEYIAFMDGDDLYASPGALSRMVDVFQQDARLFAVYGDYDMISENGKRLARPAMLKKSGKSSVTWKKSSALTWQNIARANLGTFHLQCLMIRKGTPFIPYRRRGEDEEFYAQLFKMSAQKYNQELYGIRQVPELIAHYRKRSGSLSFRPLSASDKPAHTSDSSIENTQNAIPPFYIVAGVPERYITSKNISYWVSKRWLRLVFRSVFSGNIRGGMEYIKLAYKDKRVRMTDLAWIAVRQFFDDPSIKDRILAFVRRA